MRQAVPGACGVLVLLIPSTAGCWILCNLTVRNHVRLAVHGGQAKRDRCPRQCHCTPLP